MTDDEEMAEVYRKITGRELSPPRESYPTPPPADDVSAYFPRHADWWRAHENVDPTLMLVCGIDRCPEFVGEVKADADSAIALMYSRFGDRTVPFTPRITEESLGFPSGTVLRNAETGETLAQQQQRKFDELDAETLRYVGDGTRVAKHYTAEPTAMPLEVIGHIVCPHHGIVDLPDPDALVTHLRAFLAETRHASRRRYLMFRGS
jgi:hypothetical protein